MQTTREESLQQWAEEMKALRSYEVRAAERLAWVKELRLERQALKNQRSKLPWWSYTQRHKLNLQIQDKLEEIKVVSSLPI